MTKINKFSTVLGLVICIKTLTLFAALSFAQAGFLFTSPIASTLSSAQGSSSEEDFPVSRFGVIGKEKDEGSPVRSPAGGAGLSQSPILPKGAQSIQEMALIVGDSGFLPKTLFVTRDTPVRLYVTNSSKKSLCVVVDELGVQRQVKSHKIEEIEFTPKELGPHRLYCPVNGVEGVIYVKDYSTLSSVEPDSPSLDRSVEKGE